jgi:hypothetical protein
MTTFRESYSGRDSVTLFTVLRYIGDGHFAGHGPDDTATVPKQSPSYTPLVHSAAHPLEVASQSTNARSPVSN